MDVIEHNRQGWNEESKEGCDWSIPVTSEEIAQARSGDWEVILTPKKNVPKEWFPPLQDCKILCLASGGGQQAPILSAAGADVTSFDLSDEQLAKDELVAQRDGLSLQTIRGDMRDLSALGDASFDLVFHVTSNLFVPNVKPVWRECHRILRPGGALLAGFMNPVFFLFDHEEATKAQELKVKYLLPYSDLTSLTPEEQERFRAERRTIEFGHSLEDLIGGQIQTGFTINGFYEDYWDDEATPLNVYTPTSMATRAVKP